MGQSPERRASEALPALLEVRGAVSHPIGMRAVRTHVAVRHQLPAQAHCQATLAAPSLWHASRRRPREQRSDDLRGKRTKLQF